MNEVQQKLYDSSLRDELNEAIKTNKKFDEFFIWTVLKGISSELTYIHSLTIVYQDVGPENILFLDGIIFFLKKNLFLFFCRGS
jgi:serine/threonine protein kinase